jgi:hypothetical protein
VTITASDFARERDIGHLLVRQIGGSAVGMDQDALGGLALRSVCGLDIGVADMGIARVGKVKLLFPAIGDCTVALDWSGSM